MRKNQSKLRLGFRWPLVFPLVLAIAGAIGLLWLTSLNQVALLKTTKYVLTNEMGMSFYDTPAGVEQNVIYFEDGAAADTPKPELNEGERWLDWNKIKVHAPENGWAKVDLGDGGPALYVEQAFVSSEVVPLFEGHRAESATGIRLENVPPDGWIWVLRLLYGAFCIFPWYILFGVMGKKQEKLSDNVGRALNRMGLVVVVYFVLLLLLKFIFGYNILMDWFVTSAYTGGMLFVVLQFLLGVAGVLGLFFVLLRAMEESVRFRLGTPIGILLMASGLYFCLILLGVLVAIVVCAAVVYVFFKYLLPYIIGGMAGQGRTSSSENPDRCGSCRHYSGTGICNLHKCGVSPSDSGCSRYKGN